MFRQTSFDKSLMGFNVGDLVKFINPTEPYEEGLILVVKALYHDTNLIDLVKPGGDKSYYATVNYKYIKKLDVYKNGEKEV